MELDTLNDEQKEYLAGFTVGAGLSTSGALPETSGGGSSTAEKIQATGPDRLLIEAQQAAVADGGSLVNEEKAKAERHPLDRWSEVVDRARAKEFPKGIDVFLAKTLGMFYVAPAQDSYMSRLRFPGGEISSHQLAGVADIADDLAGGYSHVTTRGNLQLREIPVDAPPEVLTRLTDLGINIKGSGGDNLRNITSSPTAGFDPQELYDSYALAREMHHYILNHREMYHLPRKFNISFDGGGLITTLADTNDIGFAAVRIDAEQATDQVPEGVYFRVQLAGITGHRQFASDCGWLVRPDQCVETAGAIVRAFVIHGDRTDRKKARLKYLIDKWGVDKFLVAVREQLPFEPIEWPLENCTPAENPIPGSHIGFHSQPQEDKCFVGVVVPVGKLTSDQMRALARMANQYGKGTLRLTCWQNVLIPHIDLGDVETVKTELQAAGLDWQLHNIRAGLVACTGNAGCKFAASDTKRHAIQIAERVEKVVELDQPINIHLTGCHHSCAQHYIGDIGLIAAKVEVPTVSIGGTQPTQTDDADDEGEEVEGYHILIGGGFGEHQGIGREFQKDVPAEQAPLVVQKIVQAYMQHRNESERFIDFCRRHEIDQLVELCQLNELQPV
ncbi:NirA family protein [Stieleria sp. TO1_6]|uniref:NirA family protein n=1 Tax=Stieleria tagensis TaxID=2956795 RepID=UPI00209B27F5|nr:NirA family protein [Stieleria tagensis]MCO8125014.1 NirA family protein [Stieleria tagensis]